MGFGVDQDRRVLPTAAQGEVVYTQHPGASAGPAVAGRAGSEERYSGKSSPPRPITGERPHGRLTP